MNWRRAALIYICLLDDPPPSGAAFELDDAEVSFPAPSGFGGNPATLAGLKCRRWTTDHYVPFALNQLASTGIAAAASLTQKLGVGLGLRSTGFSLHRETTAWLGIGRPFGNLADLGMSVVVQQLRQPNVRRRNVGLTPGIRLRLGPGVEINVWYQQRGADVPSRLLLSIRRRLDAVNYLTARWRHSATAPARLDATAEQYLHPRLRLLVGIRTRPRRFAGSARFFLGDRYLSVATVTHPYLGLSPAIGIGNTCRAP